MIRSVNQMIRWVNHAIFVIHQKMCHPCKDYMIVIHHSLLKWLKILQVLFPHINVPNPLLYNSKQLKMALLLTLKDDAIQLQASRAMLPRATLVPALSQQVRTLFIHTINATVTSHRIRTYPWRLLYNVINKVLKNRSRQWQKLLWIDWITIKQTVVAQNLHVQEGEIYQPPWDITDQLRCVATVWLRNIHLRAKANKF